MRSRAWLAGLAILVGVAAAFADFAYVVTWPETHVSGGFEIQVVVNDYFNGEVTTVQPVAWIVLGDVNRVTLQNLGTGNVTDLSFVLTDRDNATLLSITHPSQADLQNGSLTCWSYSWLDTDNVTLRIVRGAENTSFTIRILGEKVIPRPLYTYVYPLIPIVGGFALSFCLIGWGFYTLLYVTKTAWD
jgi:hypothetical protein